MEILNQTPFDTQFTMGMDKTGREYLSLVVKGTFAFPEEPSRPAPASTAQRPLVMADEFTGQPGFSATQWETDFAFRKPKCDVVLQGAAYAPGLRAVERVRIGLMVGNWSKQFDVVGPREWQVIGPAITATRPFPFERLAFGYDTAFGGIDRSVPDNPSPGAYAANPYGLGYAAVSGRSRLSGLPLPMTEAPDDPVTSPYGAYRPMALGPIARSHPHRIRYGGTYDQNWIDNVFPFLPEDFDDRYYQMAPEDQQIPFPEPHLPVVIRNLTPSGREEFLLPDTLLPIRVSRGREICFDAIVRPDTLIFDTEARALMMVWRIWVPMRKLITEFNMAWIGKPRKGMLLAEARGKAYIPAFGPGRRHVEPVT